jgi:transposase
MTLQYSNLEIAMDVIFHLPLEELIRLERLEKNAARSKRLRIVILAHGGYTAPAIAMSVGLSRRICQRWVYRYNEQGLEGLEDGRGNEPQSPLTPQQEVQVCQRLEAGPTPEDQVCSLRGVDVQRILATEFGVLRSLPGIYHLLHRLGYSYLRPRPRHRRADLSAQTQFKVDLPSRLQALREAHPQQKLRVYFQDESRFGQHGTTTNVWARRGSRPTAVRQTEYQYLWVLGTVCPETGHAEGLLSPQLNAKIINTFLAQFSQTLAADEHAAMIWDGAGFHVAGKLQVPDNVTIIQLPPYSPELNPIENLWHYLKSHFWSNRAYADYDELEQAAIQAWKKAALNPELMKTVCAAPYAKGATSN